MPLGLYFKYTLRNIPVPSAWPVGLSSSQVVLVLANVTGYGPRAFVHTLPGLGTSVTSRSKRSLVSESPSPVLVRRQHDSEHLAVAPARVSF
jgi:hypothetical protein